MAQQNLTIGCCRPFRGWDGLSAAARLQARPKAGRYVPPKPEKLECPASDQKISPLGQDMANCRSKILK